MVKSWYLLTILIAILAFSVAAWVFSTMQGQTETTEKPVQNKQGSAPSKDVPEGYQQILPRGRISAIDNPQYTSADKAAISNESYVLGIVIEGQAVAYSLNLLTRHEIVNDTIGKTNFAAVW